MRSLNIRPTSQARRKGFSIRHIGSMSLAVAGALASIPAMADAKPFRVSIVQALVAGEWNSEIRSGAEIAAKQFDFPVHIRTVGPENIDPPRQASIFMQEVQTAPDALIINNVAGPVFEQPVGEAEANGSKVVWINSAPTATFYNDFFVSADPYDAGRKVAGILAAALGKRLGRPAADIAGDVVIGSCSPGLMVLENRVLGTRSALAAAMPKAHVLPTLQTNAERSRSFVIWNEAIRKAPNALAYLDACEPGQVNIAKIIEDDHLSAVTVAYDAPEEIRDGIKRGTVLAAVPGAFFLQSYLAVHFAVQAIHGGKPLPHGWLRIVPPVIDPTNIEAFIKAWAEPQTGLPAFYKPQVDAALAKGVDAGLQPMGNYDNPVK